MIFGDCDNSFVFINALQYKIYYAYYLFSILLQVINSKNKKKTKKKTATSRFWKKLGFFAPLRRNTWHKLDAASQFGSHPRITQQSHSCDLVGELSAVMTSIKSISRRIFSSISCRISRWIFSSFSSIFRRFLADFSFYFSSISRRFFVRFFCSFFLRFLVDFMFILVDFS